ncbi:hypothetical protein AMAG_19116 [Allomyces macrogynus ATCC 38327]|uniref:60S ribosomal protein L8 n=1 Tax=Allomyces macrogynus (strain ATCC 38327) TaxID=578462 RepID=A0A0L0SNN9_ALLM3|nr:hypothetical protein AMAG_19116 [Allomyces macrogynus ATCC 38327]|eukprot:KNE64141.1 hypothetical protein AMAG_19116 [Allomyces macrogynus ATCC 38327]
MPPGSPTSSSAPVRRRTLTRKVSEHVGIGNKIDKHHQKYAFMYHLLTGVRLSVGRCESKEDRPLAPDDFKAQHKLASDVTGKELEPSQRYDFKFKDYCPMVFRKIRTAFGLTASDYLSSLTGKYIMSELSSPGRSGTTALAIVDVKPEDKQELAALVQVAQANFNDKADEIRKTWGGGIMGKKSQDKTLKRQKALAKEVSTAHLA